MQHQIIWDISRRFRRLSPCDGQVAHVLRTLPPVAARVLLPRAAPRLACVKPAASVHPEPGSNSSLYISYSSSSIPALSIPKRNQRSRFLCCWYLLPCTFVPVFSINSVILSAFRRFISDSRTHLRSSVRCPCFVTGLQR